MLFALQGQAEARGRITAPLLLSLADEAWVHLLDLVVLAISRLIQVRQCRGDTPCDPQVTDPVDRLGTSRLQEELSNLGMPFLHGLHREGGVLQACSRLAGD